MEHGQDFKEQRDAGRLREPSVPPEFEQRVMPRRSQGLDGAQGLGGARGIGEAAGPGGGQGLGATAWADHPGSRQQPGGHGQAWMAQGEQGPHPSGQWSHGPGSDAQGMAGQAPYGAAAYGWGAAGNRQVPAGSTWQVPARRKRHVTRNVLAGVGGVIAVIVGISAVNGAGHSMQTTGSSAGTAGTSGSSGTSRSSGAGGSAGTSGHARIGTTITLSGFDSGEQMGVTVMKVITDASPTDSFFAPSNGDRLYAAQFRLTDTGSAAYSDAPSNGATVVDSAGQSYQASLDTVTACQGFGGTENIAPGASGLGCIVFEVPVKAKIVAVQFTLDSGMGPQTGQWAVAG